ncbi:unnamed protein product [Cyprideis torosa]|uniref:Uncharacterized protein n=1 Tax=Cyprideis torosa TaxID=163714 RepID=A0A7R8W4V3_9CRUS|nr:unnamed protein product [Cyprideis torosa]CAG0883547.1 unnamed protein product [Cyprideis torosa]
MPIVPQSHGPFAQLEDAPPGRHISPEAKPLLYNYLEPPINLINPTEPPINLRQLSRAPDQPQPSCGAGLISFYEWPKYVARDKDLNFTQEFFLAAEEILNRNQEKIGFGSGVTAAFKLIPRKVDMVQNRVQVNLATAITPESEIEIHLQDKRDQKTSVEQVKLLNPYTIQFSIPESFFTSSRTVGVHLHLSGRSMGARAIKCESRLGKLVDILNSVNDPVEFMCEAMCLSRASTEELDQLLASAFTQNSLTSGMFRFLEFGVHPAGDVVRTSTEEFPSLLHFSAHFGFDQLTKALLPCPGSRACLLTKNASGYTPAELAKRAGHTRIVTAIQQFLAKPQEPALSSGSLTLPRVNSAPPVQAGLQRHGTPLSADYPPTAKDALKRPKPKRAGPVMPTIPGTEESLDTGPGTHRAVHVVASLPSPPKLSSDPSSNYQNAETIREHEINASRSVSRASDSKLPEYQNSAVPTSGLDYVFPRGEQDTYVIPPVPRPVEPPTPPNAMIRLRSSSDSNPPPPNSESHRSSSMVKNGGPPVMAPGSSFSLNRREYYNNSAIHMAANYDFPRPTNLEQRRHSSMGIHPPMSTQNNGFVRNASTAQVRGAEGSTQPSEEQAQQAETNAMLLGLLRMLKEEDVSESGKKFRVFFELVSECAKASGANDQQFAHLMELTQELSKKDSGQKGKGGTWRRLKGSLFRGWGGKKGAPAAAGGEASGVDRSSPNPSVDGLSTLDVGERKETSVPNSYLLDSSRPITSTVDISTSFVSVITSTSTVQLPQLPPHNGAPADHRRRPVTSVRPSLSPLLQRGPVTPIHVAQNQEYLMDTVKAFPVTDLDSLDPPPRPTVPRDPPARPSDPPPRPIVPPPRPAETLAANHKTDDEYVMHDPAEVPDQQNHTRDGYLVMYGTLKREQEKNKNSTQPRENIPSPSPRNETLPSPLPRNDKLPSPVPMHAKIPSPRKDQLASPVPRHEKLPSPSSRHDRLPSYMTRQRCPSPPSSESSSGGSQSPRRPSPLLPPAYDSPALSEEDTKDVIATAYTIVPYDSPAQSLSGDRTPPPLPDYDSPPSEDDYQSNQVPPSMVRSLVS